MVRTGVAALALTAGVLTAGCGTTHRSVSPAQLAAYARAVNLREGDVPGMSAVSTEREQTAGPLAVALAHCGGGLPGWDAGSMRSAVFATHSQIEPSVPVEALYSAVRVARSPAIAARDLAANRSPHVRTCIASAVAAVREARGPLVRESASASPLPNVLPGATGIFGLTVTRRVRFLEANPRPPEHNPGAEAERFRTQTNGVASDVLGFASGRA